MSDEKKPKMSADQLTAIAEQIDQNVSELRTECKNYDDGAPLLGHAITALGGAAECVKNHAKSLAKLAGLILLFALLTISAHAQVFYGGVTVIGTSNAPVQVNFVNVVGYASVTCPARTLQLQNTSTNEVYVLSYLGQFQGMGGTNMYLLGSLTNQLPGPGSWVNGSTFTTNIPAQTFLVPIVPWGQIAISNNVSAALTNNVLLQ